MEPTCIGNYSGPYVGRSTALDVRRSLALDWGPMRLLSGNINSVTITKKPYHEACGWLSNLWFSFGSPNTKGSILLRTQQGTIILRTICP